jgi:hypothetical protein
MLLHVIALYVKNNDLTHRCKRLQYGSLQTSFRVSVSIARLSRLREELSFYHAHAARTVDVCSSCLASVTMQ